jgi:hypothetical protein
MKKITKVHCNVSESGNSSWTGHVQLKSWDSLVSDRLDQGAVSGVKIGFVENENLETFLDLIKSLA